MSFQPGEGPGRSLLRDYTKLRVALRLKLYLQPSMTTDSGTLVAPEQFLHIPGGPLKTAAYNLTLEPDDMTAKTYIIQSTYFQYMSNLSGIYYVPAAEGDILFEVRIIFKFSRD